MRRDLAHDRAAVGQEIDDANSGQGDQCFADRSMADAIAPGKLLGDEAGAGPQLTLEHVGEQGLDDCLAAQAMPALKAVQNE